MFLALSIFATMLMAILNITGVVDLSWWLVFAPVLAWVASMAFVVVLGIGAYLTFRKL